MGARENAFIEQASYEFEILNAIVDVALEPDHGLDGFTVRGYASVFASIAHGAAGPTQFTSDAFGSSPFSVPLLYQHQLHSPIGRAMLIPDEIGLRAEGRIVPTQLGRDTLTLLKSGSISGLSIGFIATKASPGRNGVRLVSAASVEELSVVTAPADRKATVLIADNVAVPQFHAADPREIEYMSRHDWKTQLEQIEAEYRTLTGLPVPKARPQPDSEVDPDHVLDRFHQIRAAVAAEAEREDPITGAAARLHRARRS